jgi:hypothetical protein
MAATSPSGSPGSLVCALALGTLVSTSVAQAQSAYGIDGARPEAHLGIGWHGDLGVGLRVDFALVPAGLVDGVDDELALSPGADLIFNHDHHDDHDDTLGVAVPLAVQWNFYLDAWSLFPELGLALLWNEHHGRHHDHHLHLRVLFSLGARYHFSSRNAVVIRLNWPLGLQIGLTF